MKFLRLTLAAILFTLGLSGCLQIEKIVKLRPDGSGTIEETVMMSKATVAQMEGMAAGFGGAAGPKGEAAAKGFQLMDEAKLKAAADLMGEG